MTNQPSHRFIRFFAVLILVATAAQGQPPPAPPRPPVQGRTAPTVAGQSSRTGAVSGRPRGRGANARLAVPVAHLPRRAYALALSRHQVHASGKPMIDIQTKHLSDLDRLLVQVDFASFRKRFLGPDQPFPDPSADFFDLACRQQRVRNARQRISAHELLWSYLQQRVEGANSGLTQLDVDLAASKLVEAREDFDAELLAYRDRLDEVRLALGLARCARHSGPDDGRPVPGSVREDRQVVAQSPSVGERSCQPRSVLAANRGCRDRWPADPGRDRSRSGRAGSGTCRCRARGRGESRSDSGISGPEHEAPASRETTPSEPDLHHLQPGEIAVHPGDPAPGPGHGAMFCSSVSSLPTLSVWRPS